MVRLALEAVGCEYGRRYHEGILATHLVVVALRTLGFAGKHVDRGLRFDIEKVTWVKLTAAGQLGLLRIFHLILLYLASLVF